MPGYPFSVKFLPHSIIGKLNYLYYGQNSKNNATNILNFAMIFVTRRLKSRKSSRETAV